MHANLRFQLARALMGLDEVTTTDLTTEVPTATQEMLDRIEPIIDEEIERRKNEKRAIR